MVLWVMHAVWGEEKHHLWFIHTHFTTHTTASNLLISIMRTYIPLPCLLLLPKYNTNKLWDRTTSNNDRCGKTTQIPQFLLEEAEAKGEGTRVKVVVAQPRRIAAIGMFCVCVYFFCVVVLRLLCVGGGSGHVWMWLWMCLFFFEGGGEWDGLTVCVYRRPNETQSTPRFSLPHTNKHAHVRKITQSGVAQRVAEERGESVGGGGGSSSSSSVGYMIRGENKTGPCTRLAFCTTGIILRRLQQARQQVGGERGLRGLCVCLHVHTFLFVCFANQMARVIRLYTHTHSITRMKA